MSSKEPESSEVVSITHGGIGEADIDIVPDATVDATFARVSRAWKKVAIVVAVQRNE